MGLQLYTLASQINAVDEENQAELEFHILLEFIFNLIAVPIIVFADFFFLCLGFKMLERIKNQTTALIHRRN